MALHIDAIGMLEEDIEIKDGESYLQYNSWEEGWNSLKKSTHRLVEMKTELKQRNFLFRDLVRIIILTWEADDPRRRFPVYVSDLNISCIAENLEIAEKIAFNIAEEEFWDLQKFWRKRKREKNHG